MFSHHMSLLSMAIAVIWLLTIRPAHSQSTPRRPSQVPVDLPTTCTNSVVRKEIRSTTDQEWAMIAGVVRRMRRDGWFDWYAYMHDQLFDQVHENSIFFPFHRRFVRDFEVAGQRYNPAFFVPYWDAAADYQQPSNSVVLSSKYLGGNGQGSDSCLMDGVDGNVIIHYPETRCLQRSFSGQDGQILPWYSTDYIQGVIDRATTMEYLRNYIENSIHGAVHTALGGDMTTDWASIDFTFMTHHANIDRLWAIWQQKLDGKGGTYANVLDGAGPDGNQVTANTQLPGYSDVAGSVLTLNSGTMCYTYDSRDFRSADNGNTICDKFAQTPGPNYPICYSSSSSSSSSNNNSTISKRDYDFGRIPECVPIAASYQLTFCQYSYIYAERMGHSKDNVASIVDDCIKYTNAIELCFPANEWSSLSQNSSV